MKITKRIFMFILIGILSIPIFVVAYFYITWKSIIIDDNLPKQAIYKTFDHKKQKTFYVLEEEPKTNNLKISDAEFPFNEPYICNVYDEKYYLRINFQFGDGFSGEGYNIYMFENWYKLFDYSYSDIKLNVPEDDSNVLKSELKLNKSTYKKGDTIYGYVNFKIQKIRISENYIEDRNCYFKAIVE